MNHEMRGKSMNLFYRGSIVVLSIVALTVLGCGSASNNDQGVSFTMLGYSVAASSAATPGSGTGSICSTTPNLSGGVFAIGSQTEETGAAQVLAGVVTQNNLTTQFVRTQSISFEYLIPGAQIQPPTTAVPYGGVVAKAGGLLCATVSVVPPQIISWLSLNRESLPELPFLLIARGQVTGTSAAGDVFTTNPVDIGYTVVTDNVITPDDGSEDGSDDSGSAIVDESDSETGDGIEDGDSSDSPEVDPDSDAQI